MKEKEKGMKKEQKLTIPIEALQSTVDYYERILEERKGQYRMHFKKGEVAEYKEIIRQDKKAIERLTTGTGKIKEEVIICMTCNDHIDKVAQCDICTETDKQIIKELMAENKALKSGGKIEELEKIVREKVVEENEAITIGIEKGKIVLREYNYFKPLDIYESIKMGSGKTLSEAIKKARGEK